MGNYEVRFLSVSRPGVCYTWAAAFDEVVVGAEYFQPGYLHPLAGEYEIDRGSIVPVKTERGVDYLASLWVVLVNDPGIRLICWPEFDNPVLILFLSDIRAKRRAEWFNPFELRISGAARNIFKNKWFLVPQWADGSFESIVGLITIAEGMVEHGEWYPLSPNPMLYGLEQIVAMNAVREFFLIYHGRSVLFPDCPAGIEGNGALVLHSFLSVDHLCRIRRFAKADASYRTHVFRYLNMRTGGDYAKRLQCS
jgi:hypothetical protein